MLLLPNSDMAYQIRRWNWIAS